MVTQCQFHDDDLGHAVAPTPSVAPKLTLVLATTIGLVARFG